MTRERLSDLVSQAKKAQEKARAPYSHFPVGAALSTSTGKIYTGCNIEVSSYGLTICAERVAMFKALSEGESEFTAMVITAKIEDYCPPCGACRQVLFDYAPQLEIILMNSKGKLKHTSIADLLPEAFNDNFLNKQK